MLDTPVCISELQGFELFEKLSEDELSLIAKASLLRTYQEGDVVCEEGSESDSMFLVRSGTVEVSKQGVTLAKLGAGDYFGEMSLITGAPRNATVTTTSPVELVEIPAQVFHVIIARSPQASRNLLSTLDERLRRHNDKVVWQYQKLKEQFEALEDSHQRLLRSDKLASIGLLAAGIAHEINNPLFVITGYVDIVRSMLDAGEIDPDELGGIIDKLDTASQSIARLVSGIKTYVRIEDTAPSPIDLNAAIQDSLDLVSFLYRQDHIDLNIDLAAERPMIRGSVGKLQQVLMNLLSNARDSMESCENKVITVRTEADRERVTVEIRDTGCGIPEERMEHIFVHGFTTKPVGKGSGMGLNLVRQMVREMDGEITVESSQERGTSFHVRFPVQEM